jgi:cyclopropane fatty-acyl-phospholipid synthase-like methyltransferase
LAGVRNFRGILGARPPAVGEAPWQDPATAASPSGEQFRGLAPVADIPSAPAPRTRWPNARIALAESLWGAGFLAPGGEEEALRLARPLGLTAAASLLLLGAGAGGPSCAIASRLGVWVSGFEADPQLAAAAAEHSRRAGLGRRATIEAWNPADPLFRRQSHHHAMALEPLRGARPEPVLAAIRQALKPGGQLVMTELVADAPLDPADPVAADWARLECRDLALPSETTITRTLGRLGFDVRVAEDISDRHAHLASIGWRHLLARVEERPSVETAGVMVQEAELWLLRLRLIHRHRMRLFRWHAIGAMGTAPPA